MTDIDFETSVTVGLTEVGLHPSTGLQGRSDVHIMDQPTTFGSYGAGLKLTSAQICGLDIDELNEEVGSGGTLTYSVLSLPPSTVPVSCTYDLEPSWHFELLPSISHQVAGIRAFLALNVSETARVLGVERPTVYAWLTSRARPHASNREVIERVYSLARRWSRITPKPLLEWFEEQGGDREQLVDAFREPAQGERVFDALRAMWDQRRASSRFLDVRDSAERLGLSRSEEGRERIDLLSGRRVSDE